MAMSCPSLTSSPLFPLNNHPPLKPRTKQHPLLSCPSSLHNQPEEQQSDPNTGTARNESKLARLALVAVAAGILALGTPHDAMAAKTGGRVGGQAFRSAAPRSSGPRINNSRTNIYINPRVAPPLVGGYGYGGYGGWGWSPFTYFAPGPSVAVGFGGGFEIFAALLAFSAIAAVVRGFTRRRYEDDDDY